MFLGEALSFSVQALRSNPVRSLLTGLGMVIGTASVILVVTISLTSQDYILEQIEGVGSNLIYAQYEIGSQQSSAQVDADFIKLADVEAVRRELGDRIVAATGVITTFDRMRLNGKDQDVQVLGSDEYYKSVRNMAVLAGRFLDSSDVALRQKVCLLTEKLAQRLYGSQAAAEIYFGKDAQDLTIAEAAMLAGLPKAPTEDSPYSAYGRSRERQLYVLRGMVSTGARAPSALITKSAPSPSVCALAHSPDGLSPSLSTSIRSGASALTRWSSSSLRPVPRIRATPNARHRTVAATPSVPVTPSISPTVPGPAPAIRNAP